MAKFVYEVELTLGDIDFLREMQDFIADILDVIEDDNDDSSD
jgi:hypothetical protein